MPTIPPDAIHALRRRERRARAQLRRAVLHDHDPHHIASLNEEVRDAREAVREVHWHRCEAAGAHVGPFTVNERCAGWLGFSWVDCACGSTICAGEGVAA